MHGCELGEVGILHKQVQGLTLVDKITTLAAHIDDILHAEFPYRTVELLDIIRNALYALDGTVGPHELLLHVLIPQTQGDEILKQVFVDHDEFTG